ncbi:MFS transporter [Shimazuella kribbensis]|uniref:MFS transporter n=1 Tax=Shimazuella kribbensis TaxID=139808 RepID=UPI0003FFDE64|nr:MFS transporter [Shimazuella kribbensis]
MGIILLWWLFLSIRKNKTIHQFRLLIHFDQGIHTISVGMQLHEKPKKEKKKEFASYRWLLGPMKQAEAVGRFRFLTYLGHGVYDSMIASHLLDKGWKWSDILSLIIVSHLCGILIGPAWALLADALKKHKQVLTLAMFGMSACVMMQSISPMEELFWLMYFFGASVNPITTGLTANLAKSKADYAKIQSFGPLGYGLGALSIALISRYTGLIIIFYAFTIILLGCVMLLMWFPSVSEQESSARSTQQKSISKIKLIRMSLANVKKQFFHRKFIGFWVAVFLVTGPLQVFISMFGLLYESVLNDKTHDIQTGIGMATLIGYAIQWISLIALQHRDKWLDRWPEHTQQLIVFGVVLLIGARWIAIYLFPNTFTVWLAFAIQGVGIALLITTFDLQMREIAGSDLTTSGIGILYAAISLSTAISALLSSWVGNIETTVLLFGVITMIGLLVMIRTHVRQKHNRRPQLPS